MECMEGGRERERGAGTGGERQGERDREYPSQKGNR